MSGRVLIAGIGNIFFRDDGFGVEVARRLAAQPLPEGAQIMDAGIRGIHLAFELLEAYDTVILVDVTPRGGKPGTIYVIEPETSAEHIRLTATAPPFDMHAMEPGAVLNLVVSLSDRNRHVLVVGCEPASTTEGIGLTEPVAAAVEEAIRVIRELMNDMMRAEVTDAVHLG